MRRGKRACPATSVPACRCLPALCRTSIRRKLDGGRGWERAPIEGARVARRRERPALHLELLLLRLLLLLRWRWLPLLLRLLR